MSTWYEVSAPAPAAAPALSGRRSARVCVVGGGFAGLNTALGLAERGVREVVLLEARRIGFGASGRNGGFVFGGFSLGEAALAAQLGEAAARDLYQGTREAVALIRRRCRSLEIDCDLQENGVVLANWFRDPGHLHRRQALLRSRFGVEWEWLDRDALRTKVRSERYSAGLFEPEAAAIHPLKYARGLARAAATRGVSVFEQSPASGLERDGAGWRVRTPEGEVEAEQVVLCCGGYLAGLQASVDRSVLPIATYVMVTEPLGERLAEVLPGGAAVYDTRFAFDYYRPLPDRRLLWGGRISVRDRSADEVRTLLRRDMLRVFPELAEARIEHAWSGLMSYARHEMPQVANIDSGLWVAQAFGGHGVAPTTLAGEWLAEAMSGGRPLPPSLSRYGLDRAYKPFGLWAAQLTYWWLQARDGWEAWRERGAAPRHQ
ncbi:NAD(P)/FAD-dependent oxidoreductase [Pseudomarimonas salicorniae]|uniref:FAD-binding oxidoreductase n=1 Tax=Pseudomarimonas salicorniae TaxID=2933270 RepID=A0ABT0GEJ2_9GAMM|nr:FAD-binding oxidoreductase [Lysobacter sp. CAU 1642]